MYEAAAKSSCSLPVLLPNLDAALNHLRPLHKPLPLQAKLTVVMMVDDSAGWKLPGFIAPTAFRSQGPTKRVSQRDAGIHQSCACCIQCASKRAPITAHNLQQSEGTCVKPASVSSASLCTRATCRRLHRTCSTMETLLCGSGDKMAHPSTVCLMIVS